MMIRVYILTVLTVNGVEQVAGIEFIHDALLNCTVFPELRYLIMDTTQAEHDGLIAAGAQPQEATQRDIDRYHTQVEITPPDPDAEKAKELLATSPQVITAPETWELLRIFGRRFGWCD